MRTEDNLTVLVKFFSNI